MAGYDGHRGWLYYLASAPDRRGQGIGRQLVEAAEERLLAMGCPKVQLMVRPDNNAAQGFYRELGLRALRDLVDRQAPHRRLTGASTAASAVT